MYGDVTAVASDYSALTIDREFPNEPLVNPETAVAARVAARYRQDGSLVAVRIWVSARFDSVWLSPEGHVLHVDPSTDVVTVQNASGGGVPVLVDANTQFFFRQPWNPAADATPSATGFTDTRNFATAARDLDAGLSL